MVGGAISGYGKLERKGTNGKGEKIIIISFNENYHFSSPIRKIR
jgi:hypothetical protein